MNKENIGFDGGAWDESTHLKLHPKNFNHGLASFIIDIIQPKNLLEFGSGLGYLSRHIADNSSADEIYCIEPNDIKGAYSANSFPKLLSLNIFKDSIPTCIDKTFDLVMSIEVAEHIQRENHDLLFDFLVNHTNNWIIFSGARIGQGGHGHIAERDEEDWKSEFLKRGMIFHEDLTHEIRFACDEKNINHKKNLMIFTKKLKND